MSATGVIGTGTGQRLFLGLAALASILITINAATHDAVLPWARAPLLMPFLIVYVVLRRPWRDGRTIGWLLAAQVLSWVGDVALATDNATLFLVGVGFFLLAQVSYIVTFRTIPGGHLVRRRPIVLVPYGIYLVGMMALVLPDAGALWPALLVYGLLLLGMAVAAVDAWDRVGSPARGLLLLGSVLFVISDSLIALTKFGPIERSAAVATVLIGTYCIAQILLALGILSARPQVAQVPTG